MVRMMLAQTQRMKLRMRVKRRSWPCLRGRLPCPLKASRPRTSTLGSALWSHGWKRVNKGGCPAGIPARIWCPTKLWFSGPGCQLGILPIFLGSLQVWASYWRRFAVAPPGSSWSARSKGAKRTWRRRSGTSSMGHQHPPQCGWRRSTLVLGRLWLLMRGLGPSRQSSFWDRRICFASWM